jgi:hypothetical protein
MQGKLMMKGNWESKKEEKRKGCKGWLGRDIVVVAVLLDVEARMRIVECMNMCSLEDGSKDRVRN